VLLGGVESEVLGGVESEATHIDRNRKECHIQRQRIGTNTQKNFSSSKNKIRIDQFIRLIKREALAGIA
jgi:hypothetical protein